MTYNVASLPQRIASKIAINDQSSCWEWSGAKDRAGYGKIGVEGGGWALAHRRVFALLREEPGPILDHLCRVPACVNPAHLESVEARQNILRGLSFAAVNAAKSHCSNGHPFDEQNTYHRPSGGRDCRTCTTIRQQRCRNRRVA